MISFEWAIRTIILGFEAILEVNRTNNNIEVCNIKFTIIRQYATLTLRLGKVTPMATSGLLNNEAVTNFVCLPNRDSALVTITILANQGHIVTTIHFQVETLESPSSFRQVH